MFTIQKNIYICAVKRWQTFTICTLMSKKLVSTISFNSTIRCIAALVPLKVYSQPTLTTLPIPNI